MNMRLRVRQITLSFVTLACVAPAHARAQGAPAENTTAVGIFQSQADVGSTPKAGTAVYDATSHDETSDAPGGIYRVTGGGANMWGGADALHFVWKQVLGDFDLSAAVSFVGAGSQEHRKAVLAVRQSLDPNSSYADVALHGDGLTALQFRPVPGAETSEVRSPINAPVFLHLVRRGAQITMSVAKSAAGSAARCAANDDAVELSGPVTIELKGPVYVGLGVCSHDANVLETAIFSQVSLRELPATSNDLNPTKVHSDISVYDLATKKVSVVYSADTLWEAPNWTPDGKYLMANSGGKLYRISVNGNGNAPPEPVALDASYAANNDHGLSPDGKWLAISAQHGGAAASQVYVADANGGHPRLVTPNMPSYFHGWSPDGKWLAFVGERGGNFDIYRIPAVGGKEERVTSDPGFDDGPDYSVDGKWIYINSNRSGGWDIWRFPSDGAGLGDSKAERITHDAQEDWFPHPSPDGKWIAMLSFPPGTPGHDTKTSVHLRLMPATAGPVAPIKIPGNAAPPVEDWSDGIQVLTEFFGGQGTINVNSWSPDSKQFAFVSYRMPQ